MTDWYIFRGSGTAPDGPLQLPPPPPWRRLPLTTEFLGSQYQVPDDLLPAINASLLLRRPLLLTGPAGVGKSTVADAISFELGFGEVLRWDVSSSTTVADGVYKYDALDRLRAAQQDDDTDIGRFVRLGPLGTALVSPSPRVLLIDELDKGDIDLAGDLLNVLERGSFEIPELARHQADSVVVSLHDGGAVTLSGGVLQATDFPVVVLTSNGEREFPPALLRRCIQFRFPYPSARELSAIVEAHLGSAVVGELGAAIEDFAGRIDPSVGNETLAVDQLLNSLFLLSAHPKMSAAERSQLVTLLQRELRASI